MFIEKFTLSVFIFWILPNYISGAGVAKSRQSRALSPRLVQQSSWCLVCRSDRDPGCINKASDNEDLYGQKCTNASFTAFYAELEIDKPKRPAPKPRASNDEQWACYRMYTIDGSFTFRTCVISNSEIPEGEEECTNCVFQGVAAKCCTCYGINCNYRNSLAFRLMIPLVQIFTVGVLTVASVLLSII